MICLAWAAIFFIDRWYYQVVLRLADDRVLASNSITRRALARGVTAVGRDRGLLAFGAADTHLHILAVCARAEAGLLARGLALALRVPLGTTVTFSQATITPVKDHWHLKSTFAYVQRNARKHGIVDPGASEASSLHDILGMRACAPWLGERVRQLLPRTTRADLLEMLALPGLGTAGEPGPDLADAAAATFGEPSLRALTPSAVRARAAAVSLVAGRWTPDEIASRLGISLRSVQRLTAQPASAIDQAALRRQLAWRAMIGTSPSGY